MLDALALAQQLINLPSITPDDGGSLKLISDQLEAMGFEVTHLDSNGVKNIWARRGTQAPLLVFSGHVDVVPPGPETQWTTPPFDATTRDGLLYGRGAADMKGALAAMITACEHFISAHPKHLGSIGFLITSDEEGEASDGTIKIVEHLEQNKIKPEWCIIGEASSNKELGDAIKIGRRGSLHGHLQVFGKQGHIAYPHLAENPIHRSFKALDVLSHTEWDQGNEHFSPTSFQIYNIEADTGATNVIPGSLQARFNFRFSPASSVETLQDQLQKVLDDHALNYHIDWRLSSEPFLSQPDKLTQACRESIKEICNIDTHPNTTGGTSDGRFIARLGCEIVELGAVSSCIHQVDEHIAVNDLERLTVLYRSILEKLL